VDGLARLDTPSTRPIPALEDYEPFRWHERLSLWRIQDSPQFSVRRYPEPKYRFDAPRGEYATVYTNSSDIGTFAEVYRMERRGRLGPAEGERYLVEITTTESLPLIDLTDVRLLSALRLDDRISTGDHYDICRAWALAFHQDRVDLCGIRYWPRKAGRDSTNIVLFAERCSAFVSVASANKLKHMEGTVLTAADLYDLVVKFRFE
jgi:hypothetical protein